MRKRTLRLREGNPQSAHLRPFLSLLILLAAVGLASGQSADTRAARAFLVGLFDETRGLLPEYPGARVFWLYHDNYLAVRLLRTSHPEVAARIEASLAQYEVAGESKMEILFEEARDPLPFRPHVWETVEEGPGYEIRTERVGEGRLPDWNQYADLLLLAAYAERGEHPARAVRHFRKALAMWDGVGLRDAATEASELYAAYKLGLLLYVGAALKQTVPMREAIKRQLAALQTPGGGVVTDYNAEGKPVGLPNVETTCLVVLGVEAARP